MKSSIAFRTLALLVLSTTITGLANDWPQWRGPQRNGTSTETGLLTEWPKGGPKLLWQAKEIGSGYSTPSVVGPELYLLGNEGLENEFVQALAVADGKRLWSAPLGKVGNPNQKPNFPAARSTPTIDGEWLYALGSDGDLVCVKRDTGALRWRKSLRRDFQGKPGTWAYAESPLVDGEKLICSPGGANASLVALNKNTGEVIWKCAVPGGGDAAYASAIVVEVGEVRQYVQMLQKGLVGLEASSGKLLWRYDKTVSNYDANIPSPVAHGAHVYSAGSGTGGGMVKLTVQDGAVRADEVYFSPKLPTAIGGAVRVGDFLYGTTGQGMLCVEFATGKVRWEDRALGSASICCADGRLYLRGENGQVGLIEPTPEAYREKARFTPPDAPAHANSMEKAWAYPVVSNGRLYVRDLGSLWCYDVKAGQ